MDSVLISEYVRLLGALTGKLIILYLGYQQGRKIFNMRKPEKPNTKKPDFITPVKKDWMTEKQRAEFTALCKGGKHNG
jgi:hypothetical protein